MTPRRKLSEAALRNLQPGQELFDTDVPQLSIRQGQRKASWRVLYRVVVGHNDKGRPEYGSRRVETLGSYPALGLSDARTRARAVVSAAEGGKDARAAKLAEIKKRIDSGKISDLFDKILDKRIGARKAGELNQRTVDSRKLSAGRAIEAAGDMYVKDMEEWTIALMDALEAQHAEGKLTAVAANEILRHVRELFSTAWKQRRIRRNPLQGFGRLLPHQPKKKHALPREDLRAIWNAAGKLRADHRAFVRVIMVTALRLSACCNLRREDLRPDGLLIVPGSISKNDKEFRLFLPPRLLAEIPEHKGEFLFGRYNIANHKRIRADLGKLLADKDLKYSDWSWHWFRVALATHLEEELDYPSIMGGLCLNHTKRGLDAIYSKADQRKQRLEALTRYMDWILADTEAEVIPFKEAAHG